MAKAIAARVALASLLLLGGCGGSSCGSTNPPSSTPPLPVIAPSNLTAAAASSSQINLSWTNNATNQTGFSILRSPDGVTFTVVGTAPANATAFQDGGLFPLTTYWYEVVATNASSASTPSNMASATTNTVTWVPLTPGGTLPTARAGIAAVNDSATLQMLTYSGDDGSFPSSNVDTLALNLPGGGSPAWTPKSTGPGVRINYSLVFNPASQKCVLFGGLDASNPLNTTLILDPAVGWSTLPTTGTPPSPRFGHTAILSGTKMVVFGGQNANPPPNNLLNDLYVLDFAPATPTWTQLTTAGSPPAPRAFHTAICDTGNNQMVVFSGTDGNNLRNDTWFLTLSGTPTWTPLTLSGFPPPGRNGATAIYHSAAQWMVVFGGFSSSSSINDVWLLSLAGQPVWKQVLPAGPLPPGRSNHAAIFDPTTPRMLIFAGQDSVPFPPTLFNDLWALDF